MRLTILAVLLGLATAATAAAQEFLPGFEDLPVMSGLTVLPDRGHVFDTPAGRLVETFAEGRVDRDAVLRFYRETLGELGWATASDGSYRREDEVLTIEIEGGDGTLTVGFRLSPRRQ